MLPHGQSPQSPALTGLENSINVPSANLAAQETDSDAFQSDNTGRCDIYCKLLAFVTPCLFILVLIGIVQWSIRVFRKKYCGLYYTCTPSSEEQRDDKKTKQRKKKKRNNSKRKSEKECKKDQKQNHPCCDPKNRKYKKKKCYSNKKEARRSACSYRIEHDKLGGPLNTLKNLTDEDGQESIGSSSRSSSSSASESSDWNPRIHRHPRNFRLWPRVVHSAEEARWTHDKRIRREQNLSAEKKMEENLKPLYEEISLEKQNLSSSPRDKEMKDFISSDSSSAEAVEYVRTLLSSRGVYRNFEEKVIIESKNDCSSTSDPPISVVRFSLFGFFVQTDDGYRFILHTPNYLYWKWNGESFQKCPPIRLHNHEYELHYTNCEQVYQEGKLSVKPKGFCINFSYGG